MALLGDTPPRAVKIKPLGGRKMWFSKLQTMLFGIRRGLLKKIDYRKRLFQA
jgi:hypothetical protein